mgnify:CR=1 FL=1
MSLPFAINHITAPSLRYAWFVVAVLALGGCSTQIGRVIWAKVLKP